MKVIAERKPTSPDYNQLQLVAESENDRGVLRLLVKLYTRQARDNGGLITDVTLTDRVEITQEEQP